MSTAVDFDIRSVARDPETRRRPVAARRLQPKLASRRPEGDSRAAQRPGVVVAQHWSTDGALTRVVARRSSARLPTDSAPVRPVAASQPRSSRACTAGSVRLTRLGRLVVSLSLFATACVGVAAVGGPALSTGEAHHSASRTVVISSGETLWDIAERIAPGEDPRAVIDDIVDLNALSDAGAVRVGQQIEVPTY